MEIIHTIKEMQNRADEIRGKGRHIGFVPTMGYLHEGHLSLLDIALQHTDVAIMSIFVNPAQFAPHEDLDSYPRDFKRDERLARERGCDIVFYPQANEMYPKPYRTHVAVKELTERLCGASRPTFFQGVTTVVTKLINIVKPHVAVFGQKDAQQAFVIKQMVRDLHMDIDLFVGPIVREKDGLAMSSRNEYLSDQERLDAVALYQALNKAKEMIRAGEGNAKMIENEIRKILYSVSTSRVDYIEIVDTKDLNPVEVISNDTLIAIAAWIGKTRLIDNFIASSCN